MGHRERHPAGHKEDQFGLGNEAGNERHDDVLVRVAAIDHQEGGAVDQVGDGVVPQRLFGEPPVSAERPERGVDRRSCRSVQPCRRWVHIGSALYILNDGDRQAGLADASLADEAYEPVRLQLGDNRANRRFSTDDRPGRRRCRRPAYGRESCRCRWRRGILASEGQDVAFDLAKFGQRRETVPVDQAFFEMCDGRECVDTAGQSRERARLDCAESLAVGDGVQQVFGGRQCLRDVPQLKQQFGVAFGHSLVENRQPGGLASCEFVMSELGERFTMPHGDGISGVSERFGAAGRTGGIDEQFEASGIVFVGLETKLEPVCGAQQPVFGQSVAQASDLAQQSSGCSCRRMTLPNDVDKALGPNGLPAVDGEAREQPAFQGRIDIVAIDIDPTKDANLQPSADMAVLIVGQQFLRRGRCVPH